MALTKVLKCGLINIQSVGNKTIKIRNLISDENFDVCMFTETWLKGDVGDFSRIKELMPKTHDFLHILRTGKIGGGVGIIVTKSFSKVKVKNQTTFETFEHINLEILNKKNIINLTIVYRPPTISGKRKENEFIEEFSNYLDTINDVEKKTLICGGFNLWMDTTNNKYTSEFNELLDLHGLTNSVSEPTTVFWAYY